MYFLCLMLLGSVLISGVLCLPQKPKQQQQQQQQQQCQEGMGTLKAASNFGQLPFWFGGPHRLSSPPQEVPRRTWLDDRDSAQGISRQRTPLILEGSPSAQQWPAAKWFGSTETCSDVTSVESNNSSVTIEDLLMARFGLNKLRGVKRHNKKTPVFVYEDRSRLMADTGRYGNKYVEIAPGQKKVSLGTRRFLKASMNGVNLPNTSKNSWYYYSYSLPKLNVSEVQQTSPANTNIDGLTDEPQQAMHNKIKAAVAGTKKTRSKKNSKKRRNKKNGSSEEVKRHNEAMRRISEDCSPREMFAVSEGTANEVFENGSLVDDTAYGSYLWMGGPNVTASLHYDRSHNFFAQLAGCKRFYIWEPMQLPDLYIYPFYHARDRQSQLVAAEWGEPGCRTFNSLSQKFPRTVNTQRGVPVFVADLHPGDLLYLPPYWAHRVTSIGDGLSISVNMWSPGEEKLVGDALNKEGLPSIVGEALNAKQIPNNRDSLHESSILSRQRHKIGVGVTAIFLRKVIMKTLGMFSEDARRNSSHSKYVDPLPLLQTLYETRYAPEHHRYDCGTSGGENKGFDPSRCPRFVPVSDKDMADVDHTADRVASRFRSLVLLPSQHGDAVAELLLSDYAERLITFAVGLERACAFLRCIGTENTFQQA